MVLISETNFIVEMCWNHYVVQNHLSFLLVFSLDALKESTQSIMLSVMYQVTNSEGTWVQLDKNSMVEFCESDEGEAWSLARDRGGNQYLRHEDGKLA